MKEFINPLRGLTLGERDFYNNMTSTRSKIKTLKC